MQCQKSGTVLKKYAHIFDLVIRLRQDSRVLIEQTGHVPIICPSKQARFAEYKSELVVCKLARQHVEWMPRPCGDP